MFFGNLVKGDRGWKERLFRKRSRLEKNDKNGKRLSVKERGRDKKKGRKSFASEERERERRVLGRKGGREKRTEECADSRGWREREGTWPWPPLRGNSVKVSADELPPLEEGD